MDFSEGRAVVRGSAKFEDLATAVEQAGYTAKSMSSTSPEKMETCCNRVSTPPDSTTTETTLSHIETHRDRKSKETEIGSLADTQYTLLALSSQLL